MLQAVFTATSGLLTFDRGLDVVSNNITNLNTPGFKGQDLVYRDLPYQWEISNEFEEHLTTAQIGSGVSGQSTKTRFFQGEFDETGNGTDVAVDGSGFFMLREDGQRFYTRAGQFEFNGDDILVSTSRGSARVAGVDDEGRLGDISLAGLRVSPPQATSQVDFTGNLSRNDTSFRLDDVEVFDSLGIIHPLALEFTNNAISLDGSWLVSVFDENGDLLLEDGEIRFQGNGSPAAGFNELSFVYEPQGAEAQPLTLFFGDPGSFDGVTSFAGPESDVEVASQDGYAQGAVSTVGFDRDGRLTVTYTNEQTATGDRLALAAFRDLQSLRHLGEALFVPQDGQDATIGPANEGLVGGIVDRNLEQSNVELTQEFTDLIIVQRGFQASSQVLQVANEMIEELLNLDRSTSS